MDIISPSAQFMTDLPKLTLLFFYGKGGAGKDSEAESLVRDNPHWAVISTGDRIKQARNPEDEFHSIVAPYEYLIDQGRNLPMDVVMNEAEPLRSIFPAFIESGIGKGITTIISTGFPRTLAQLHALDRYMANLRQRLDVQDMHFHFNVSDETSIRRIVNRPAENLELGKPVRSDDTQEVARRRLEVFSTDTLPLIEELRDRCRLYEIDSEGTKDQTNASVEGYLLTMPELETTEISIRRPGEIK